jgi:hypothetical protein
MAWNDLNTPFTFMFNNGRWELIERGQLN